jgi:hypothetical protein
LSTLPTGRKFGHTIQKGPSKKRERPKNLRPSWGKIFPERAEKGPNFEPVILPYFFLMNALKNWTFHRFWDSETVE